MARKTVNIGTSPNDGTGDSLRTSFDKINDNFEELYGRTAAGNNFDFNENTLTTTNTNGDIILDPNGTGKVIISGNKINISTAKTPASSVGTSGDRAGDIAYDSQYIYVCTANYDGSSTIWKRSLLSTW